MNKHRAPTGSTPSSSSNSPITRNPIHAPASSGTPRSRSPAKFSAGKGHQELGLSLQRVIGTTCQSVNCFDFLPSARAFAYTAGAAAVVTTVGEDGDISQRFFRANPLQSFTSATRTGGASSLAVREAHHGTPEARHKSPLQNRDYNIHERFDWNPDSPTANKGSGVKERVKAATAVSFSPNAKFLAIGETGYKPRILIFPLADRNGGVESPIAIINEHTFGIQAVAFSPDSKYLASLGSVNNGFIFIWGVDERTAAVSLVASNKCTSAIRQMAWFGENLVTVGVRFVKIWKPQEMAGSSTEMAEQQQKFLKGHRPLAGRNCVLGDMIEATFTAVVPLSSKKAAICSDGGDVCIVDDCEKNQKLVRVAKLDFSISAACLTPEGKLLVTGLDGSMKLLDIPDEPAVAPPAALPLSRSPTPEKALARSACYFVAVGAIGTSAVTVDSEHGIQIRPISLNDVEESDSAVEHLPAHSDAVLGVRALSAPNNLEASFLTWSASGTIIFWSKYRAQSTVHIPLDQSADANTTTNELRAVVASSAASHAITGDKYGMLRLVDTRTGKLLSSVRAHAGEITDLAMYETPQHALVASSSRDRTLQLFSWTNKSMDLVQTLDDHAGSVNGVLFANNGSQLLSCSLDRTVVVRDAVDRGDGRPPVYFITRTITLKNSPTSMRPSVYADTILVSATDRCIQLINTQSGRVVSSFKASDCEGGEAVVMGSLQHLPSPTGPPIIAGISSSDKSVRLYSEDGTLLARDWGHTEGVTDIALVTSSPHFGREEGLDTRLITVAADGTVFIWSTKPESSRPNSRDSDPGVANSTNNNLGVAAQPPLRKVISHSELTRYKRAQSIDSGDEPPSPRTATPSSKPGSVLRKKASKLTVKTTPRMEPSPLSQLRSANHRSRQRSPSPPSPSKAKQTISSQAKIAAYHDGPQSPRRTEFGSVSASTDQVSRTLKAYRQRVERSYGNVAAERLKELARELDLTKQFVQGLLAKDSPKDGEKGSTRTLSESSTSTRQDEPVGREEGTPKQQGKHGAGSEDSCLPASGGEQEWRPQSAESQDTSFASAES